MGRSGSGEDKELDCSPQGGGGVVLKKCWYHGHGMDVQLEILTTT